MKRKDDCEKVKSIWDMRGNDQQRTVGVKEGGQERGWNGSDDHTPSGEMVLHPLTSRRLQVERKRSSRVCVKKKPNLRS